MSIVDDDASIREALKRLMRSARFNVEAFGSAEEFLASGRFNDTACLILDVYLPGMNGFDLQDRLRRDGLEIPIVFITGQRDEALGSHLIKLGAVECLSKPFSEVDLEQAVHAALRTN